MRKSSSRDRITNIVIHVIVTLLFYFVTLRLFGNHSVAITAAPIFSIHAVHVEPIPVIANRTDPPTSIFM